MYRVNSYILLDNEHEVEDTTKNISLEELEKEDLKDFFIKKIKPLFKDVIEEEKCNEGMTISKKIVGKYYDSDDIDIILIMNNVGYDIFLEIHINSENVENIINCLEEFDKRLNKDLTSKYNLITTYDAISEFYSNLSYDKLNRFERLFRQLFFYVYIVNFGKEYYEKTIPTDLVNKINRIIGAKGNNDKRREIRIKEFFYSITYEHMIKILFEKNWGPLEQKFKEDLLIKEDYKTIEEIKDKIKLLEPRNDFERLFKDKFQYMLDLENVLDELRILRNKVAHCKIFRKPDYERCNEIIEKIVPRIDEANKMVYEIDFNKRNKIFMEPLYTTMSEVLREFGRILSDCVNEILTNSN